jgi:hypothetical protein
MLPTSNDRCCSGAVVWATGIGAVEDIAIATATIPNRLHIVDISPERLEARRPSGGPVPPAAYAAQHRETVLIARHREIEGNRRGNDAGTDREQQRQ